MREASGTTTTMKMALAFTILFSAFLAIAITYNKAFKIKNESLSILEKYEGVNNTSITIINNYLKNNGYNGKGKCKDNEYGVSSLNNDYYEKVNSNNDYYYCLNYHCSKGTCKITNNNQIFYKFKLFFKFNLPFLGELTTFKIDGETKAIKLFQEEQKLK